VVVALILIGLILPVFYVTASTLAGRNPATPVRDYQYSNAKESQVDINGIQAVLASLAQTMNPNELNLLREKLGGVTQLPGQSDPLGEYIQALKNFSIKMEEIQAKLNDTRTSIASGNTRQATADLEQLTKLRDEARSLLQSLTVLLDRLTGRYRIDLTVQQRKVEGLGFLFQTYSGEIDQLGARVEALQGSILTALSLNATKLEAFVNESIPIFGFLRSQNGTALSGRNVTIAWNGNKSVLRVTDFEGRFEASISFSVGFSAGLTRVEADYVPQGNDVNVYLPSTSLLHIKITYRPSIIVAEISPATVRPSDYATVKGTLSTAQGRPLTFRTIIVQVDQDLTENFTTDSTGRFRFLFSVPQTMNNGTHNVTVSFRANGEAFAPSNLTLPFVVEKLGTQTLISTDRSSLLSGMNLIVRGNVTYANGTAPTGTNVTIFLDGLPFRNATIKDDGSYLSVFQLPIWTSLGSHSIKAEYVPDRPWVQSSNAVAVIFIYSPPLIIFAAVSISAASSVGFYLFRRSRRAVVLAPSALPEPVALEKPARVVLPPEDLISAIKAENAPATRIRKSYFFAQAIINQKIGESSRTGETHWEYFFRVTKLVPRINNTLKRLVELYELAEYSPFPIESAQSREATEVLLELREEIESVK
jgi:hypothetical protein